MDSIHPESVKAVATKDFQDAVRSWTFWGLSIFFFTLLAVITGFIWQFGGELIAAEELTTEVLISTTSQVTRVLIPVIALILGWKAIAGERETGTMKVMLALPHSRTDVVVGKLLGRSLVLSLSLVIGFALAAVVVAAFMGAFGIVDYVGLLVMSIIYGIAYLSIAVAISALTKSTTIAGVGIFSVFLLFYVIWNAILSVVQALVFFEYLSGVEVDVNGMTTERPPNWAFFIDSLDPGAAYGNALTLVTSAADLGFEGEAGEALFDGAVPFYLQDWFAFVILLLWIAVPLVFAVWRFNQVDL